MLVGLDPEYIYIYIYIYITHPGISRKIYVNCAGIFADCAGNGAAIGRDSQRIARIVLSPKFCVILKKFRTNFKVLHGQDPKN